MIKKTEMLEVRSELKKACEKKWEDPDFDKFDNRVDYENFSEYEEKKWNDFLDDHEWDDFVDDRESPIRLYKILKLKT